MASCAKVSLFVCFSCFFMCYAFARPRLVTTIEGKEADTAKQFIEEVVVESYLTVKDKDNRKGRSNSQRIPAAGDTVVLNRKTRSPQFLGGPYQGYPNQGYQNPGYQNPYQQPGYQNGYPQQGGGYLPNYPQQGYQPPRSDWTNSNAQSQGFDVDTPVGVLGGSSTNALTQGFSADPSGIRGGAGVAGTQEYKLPFGQKLNVAYGNDFTVNNGLVGQSGANTVFLTNPYGDRYQLYKEKEGIADKKDKDSISPEETHKTEGENNVKNEIEDKTVEVAKDENVVKDVNIVDDSKTGLLVGKEDPPKATQKEKV